MTSIRFRASHEHENTFRKFKLLSFFKQFNQKLFHSSESSRVCCMYIFCSTSPPVSTTTSPPCAGSLTLLHTIVVAYEIQCSNICMKCLKKLEQTCENIFFQCVFHCFFLGFISRLRSHSRFSPPPASIRTPLPCYRFPITRNSVF